MRWLDGITDSVDTGLGELWEEELGEMMWRVRQEQAKLEKEWCRGVGGVAITFFQSNAFLTSF